MPNMIKGEVKDLINRMLQPNPVKRITVSEIKAHPWFNVDIPPYIRNMMEDYVDCQGPIFDQEVDADLLNQLKSFSLNLEGKSEAELKRSILEKKNLEFCAVYEILLSEKMKQIIMQQHDPDFKFIRSKKKEKTLSH